MAAAITFSHTDSATADPFVINVTGVSAGTNQAGSGAGNTARGGGCATLAGTGGMWLLALPAMNWLRRRRGTRANQA